ncbi:polysaccharide deacetylase family protein [Urechidicola sp. KH5]
MLLVYTHKITPRLNYIFKQIFVRIIQIPIDFTTSIEAFVAHNGPKMSYTNKPLGSEFHIRSHQLLFDQGINDLEINVFDWEGIPCFFATGKSSAIPFDLFAASFYLISRYEEYLPYVQDAHERFSAEDSLAYKFKFLERPLVDIWAFKFLESIKEKFPDYTYSSRTFEFVPTFDIDNVYAYKHKGIIRNTGGFFRDILRFQFPNLLERILVLLRVRKDPYDTYQFILNQTKKYNLKTIFFFLIGDYTTYDTNVSSTNSNYKSLIKSIADYVDVGLHPSYFTMTNTKKLKTEKSRLESIVNRPITKSRQHYLRIKMPDTYQNLIDLDITEDHSMGYANRYGFRASTCTPFYFYDLDFEIQTPLKVVPFAVMDGTLNYYLKLVPAVSKVRICQMIDEVKNVNGKFVLLFHNETLSETDVWKGWRKLFRDVLKYVYD